MTDRCKVALWGTVVMCALLSCAIAIPVRAGQNVAQEQAVPAPNFGSPPSGAIPILFNDHHVYAKPDTLKAGRVLAALVRGGTILIPLRSMFEQMGASVSYDAGSKTATVTKPGAEVKVTVGQPQVIINGESRPLDVPPIIYQGTVLVPIRVISEGMGAYVQWVPDQKLVVVRYLPPSPPPPPATEAPTALPTVAPTPTPAPKATPRLGVNVQFRAYDFTRQNASNTTQGGANTAINQTAFNLSVAPTVTYKIWKGLNVGATYLYANPLNGCATPQQHLTPPCKAVVPHGQLPNGGVLNYDDTLPGFQLNTLTQGYVGWKDKHVAAKVGNQYINTPWAPASDSRIKPSAYQGADATYVSTGGLTFEGTDMVRFENRTASDFSRSTLLTSFPAGAPGIASNIYNPGGQTIQTSGYNMGRLGYTTPNNAIAANFWYYGFLNIATAFWLDGKFAFNQVPFKPYIQIQAGDEVNAGTSVIGKINSQVYGILGGIIPSKNILVTAAYDWIPNKTDNIVLPTGYKCGGANTIGVGVVHQSLSYFLPSGGTANCSKEANGTTNIYYGGWASPYSDSYATDPLFTTSLTQGMIDRRSAGQSYLGRITLTSSDKKIVLYGSYAGYDYNNLGGAQATHEVDGDALFYFSKPAPVGQLYHGLLFHYRYGDRRQSGNTAPLPAGYGGTPLFKYNRFQLEYDI